MEKKILEIEKKILSKINNSFDFAKKSPFPRIIDRFEDVYAK